jgi:SWI/SNF-related matrix-associated actin-dependent regulator of chromatin subfamily A-like protein 1
VDYTGSCNLTELNSLLSSSLMIRRLKKDVLSELPPKARKTIELTISTEELKKLEDEKKNETAFIQLWQKTGIAKLSALRKYVSIEIKTGNKFLVFAHHISVMDGLEEELKKVNFFFLTSLEQN